MAAGMAACPTFEDSAGVQSLVDGIRAEMMVAMLEGLQGTAAACAEICLRRLEAQRKEFVPVCEAEAEAQRREFVPVCGAETMMETMMAETMMADVSHEQAKNFSTTDCADTEEESQEESLGASSWPSGVEGAASADQVEHFCMDMEDDDGAADSPAPVEQSQACEKGTDSEEERVVAADVADLDDWYGEEASPAAEEPEAAAAEAESAAPVQAALEPAEASPAAEEAEAAATQAESAAPAQAAPEPAEAAVIAAAQQGPESSDPSPAGATVDAKQAEEAEQATAVEAAPPKPATEEHPGLEEELRPGAAPDLPPAAGRGSGALEYPADTPKKQAKQEKEEAEEEAEDGPRTLLDADDDEAAGPQTPEKRSYDEASLTTPEKALAPTIEGSRGEASSETPEKASAPAATASTSGGPVAGEASEEASAPATTASTTGGPVAGGSDAKGIASTTRWLVVGGGDSKGITVRMGRELDSATLSERLSTGAVIRQLRRVKDRVHYELESGDGPANGWVSSKLGNGKVLLEKVSSAQPGLDGEDEELVQKKVPVAKTVEGRNGLQLVVVTEYWQQVPDGAACPQGCEFHCDMKTGKNHVRKTTT